MKKRRRGLTASASPTRLPRDLHRLKLTSDDGAIGGSLVKGVGERGRTATPRAGARAREVEEVREQGEQDGSQGEQNRAKRRDARPGKSARGHVGQPRRSL